MSEAVIEVRGVGKLYRLEQDRAAYGTLRDAVAGTLARRGARPPAKSIWALRDVDLAVDEGEAVGLIGTNGAGKTTLLRILARITEPTVGVSRTRGRVGALLEVGTGFHPELSGRENVFLSGAVMGMSRVDVRRRYDEIVEFARVADFMGTPLKRYSSGMRLRLAFAVAAHLEPELMLVDEVLAVGDVEFQRRCLRRMSTLRAEGRTVVFVSHDLGAITRLCPRAVWIDRGALRRDGEAREVVEEYYDAILSQSGSVELPVEDEVAISSVAITDGEGTSLSRPQRGDPLHVELTIDAARRVPGLDLAVYVLSPDGSRYLDEAWSDQPDIPELAPGPGRYRVRLRVPPVLRAADYVVGVWLGTEHHTYVHREVLPFSVTPRAGDRQEWLMRRRLVHPVATWRHAAAREREE